MHGFIERFADGVFYPEEVEILTAAFDDAWTGVQASQAPFAAEDYASAAREILAKHIIMAAQRGERDRRRLTDGALLHLSQQKLSKKPPAEFCISHIRGGAAHWPGQPPLLSHQEPRTNRPAPIRSDQSRSCRLSRQDDT
jgi:hypothetical protein